MVVAREADRDLLFETWAGRKPGGGWQEKPEKLVESSALKSPSTLLVTPLGASPSTGRSTIGGTVCAGGPF